MRPPVTDSTVLVELEAMARLAVELSLEQADFASRDQTPDDLKQSIWEVDEELKALNRYSYDLSELGKQEQVRLRALRATLREEQAEYAKDAKINAGLWLKHARQIDRVLKRLPRMESDRERLEALANSDLYNVSLVLPAQDRVKLLAWRRRILTTPALAAVSVKAAAAAAPPQVAVAELPPPTPLEFDDADQTIIERLIGGKIDPVDDYLLNVQGQHLSLVTGFEALLCLPLLHRIEQFPFQVNTAKQVLRTMRGRALLCDEVGLGKTVEAGMIMKEYLVRGLARKVLVLTPPSLVTQWQEEMNDKFAIPLVANTDPEFRSHGANAWKECDRVIVSLHTAKSAANSQQIHAIAYDLVIIDEAHHLRNRDTVNWKFANGIKSKYVLLLTATPAQNNLDELFNLITLITPGQLKTVTNFRKEFVDRKDPRKPKNQTKLRELMMDVMVRNTRAQVGIALPPRHAHTVSVDLSPDERALYTAISGFIRKSAGDSGAQRIIGRTLLSEVGSSAASVASTLINMREKHPDRHGELHALIETALAVTDSSKLVALTGVLREGHDKAIVFTQYRATQRAIAGALHQAGITTALFDGALSIAEKDAQIALFAGDARVLISTDAGSEGRNLQFCHMVINYDLPWNPMRIEQRVGRVHRIGQTKAVSIVNFAARDTVEDYVLQVLDKKINMFELVVGEIGEILGNLQQDQEFDEVVYQIWSQAKSDSDAAKLFDDLGDQMIEARKTYLETKAYDDALFGRDFEAQE